MLNDPYPTLTQAARTHGHAALAMIEADRGAAASAVYALALIDACRAHLVAKLGRPQAYDRICAQADEIFNAEMGDA
jgi:hypothetical protein